MPLSGDGITNSEGDPHNLQVRRWLRVQASDVQPAQRWFADAEWWFEGPRHQWGKPAVPSLPWCARRVRPSTSQAVGWQQCHSAGQFGHLRPTSRWVNSRMTHTLRTSNRISQKKSPNERRVYPPSRSTRPRTPPRTGERRSRWWGTNTRDRSCPITHSDPSGLSLDP